MNGREGGGLEVPLGGEVKTWGRVGVWPLSQLYLCSFCQVIRIKLIMGWIRVSLAWEPAGLGYVLHNVCMTRHI